MSTQENRITGQLSHISNFNDLIEEKMNISHRAKLIDGHFEILKQKITRIFKDNLDEIPQEHRYKFKDSICILIDLVENYQKGSHILLETKTPRELVKYMGDVTLKTETFMTRILEKFKMEKNQRDLIIL